MRQGGRHSFFVLAAMAAASVSLMACPATLDDECADNACDPAAQTDAGEDGRRDANTDPCVVNPSDPACMDETTAVFVSNDGNNGAEGTRAAPLKTLDAALEKVTDARRRIYVCEGTYAANVEIKTSVSLVGGFKCSWDATGAKVKIAPPKGIALRITKVDGPVVVQDVEIVGTADKDVKGDSAIAVFVSESNDVTFKNATLRAGAGVAGESGASRSNYSVAAKPGNNASGSTAGSGPSCSCLDGETSSKGGNGAAGNGADFSAGSSVPSIGSPNSGSSNLTTCGDGTVGANGESNAAGTAVAAAGSLSGTGWTSVTAAIDAPNGNPGQGGGGGGAKTQGTQAGGGGGCGGCGGAGAGSGANGGSSFALLSFNSAVVVTGGVLGTAAGGTGGKGGDGQPGQAGGGIGTGACNGGPGGNGAGGSGGSGGAGGHSVHVGFVGNEPTVTDAEMQPGSKGTGGEGGKAGAGPGKPGAVGTPGPDGKAQSSLAL